jgi:hypothetical protein
MPSRIVFKMPRFWRPGTTARAMKPAMRPTTMRLMMSPSMVISLLCEHVRKTRGGARSGR